MSIGPGKPTINFTQMFSETSGEEEKSSESTALSSTHQEIEFESQIAPGNQPASLEPLAAVMSQYSVDNLLEGLHLSCADIDQEELRKAFEEIAAATAGCKFYSDRIMANLSGVESLRVENLVTSVGSTTAAVHDVSPIDAVGAELKSIATLPVRNNAPINSKKRKIINPPLKELAGSSDQKNWKRNRLSVPIPFAVSQLRYDIELNRIHETLENIQKLNTHFHESGELRDLLGPLDAIYRGLSKAQRRIILEEPVSSFRNIRFSGPIVIKPEVIDLADE